MAENPKVTSKFDRMHGRSRVPGSVKRPGGVATGGAMESTHQGRSPRESDSRIGVTHGSDHREEAAHRHHEYGAGEHGRMERGEHAPHPGARRRE